MKKQIVHFVANGGAFPLDVIAQMVAMMEKMQVRIDKLEEYCDSLSRRIDDID